MSKQAFLGPNFRSAPSPRSVPLEDPYSFGQRPVVEGQGDFGQTKCLKGSDLKDVGAKLKVAWFTSNHRKTKPRSPMVEKQLR